MNLQTSARAQPKLKNSISLKQAFYQQQMSFLGHTKMELASIQILFRDIFQSLKDKTFQNIKLQKNAISNQKHPKTVKNHPNIDNLQYINALKNKFKQLLLYFKSQILSIQLNTRNKPIIMKEQIVINKQEMNPYYTSKSNDQVQELIIFDYYQLKLKQLNQMLINSEQNSNRLAQNIRNGTTKAIQPIYISTKNNENIQIIHKYLQTKTRLLAKLKQNLNLVTKGRKLLKQYNKYTQQIYTYNVQKCIQKQIPFSKVKIIESKAQKNVYSDSDSNQYYKQFNIKDYQKQRDNKNNISKSNLNKKNINSLSTNIQSNPANGLIPQLNYRQMKNKYHINPLRNHCFEIILKSFYYQTKIQNLKLQAQNKILTKSLQINSNNQIIKQLRQQFSKQGQKYYKQINQQNQCQKAILYLKYQYQTLTKNFEQRREGLKYNKQKISKDFPLVQAKGLKQVKRYKSQGKNKNGKANKLFPQQKINQIKKKLNKKNKKQNDFN